MQSVCWHSTDMKRKSSHWISAFFRTKTLIRGFFVGFTQQSMKFSRMDNLPPDICHRKRIAGAITCRSYNTTGCVHLFIQNQTLMNQGTLVHIVPGTWVHGGTKKHTLTHTYRFVYHTKDVSIRVMVNVYNRCYPKHFHLHYYITLNASPHKNRYGIDMFRFCI